MSKMPFLPYLRMHTLNLESPSDSDHSSVQHNAETSETGRSNTVPVDTLRIDRIDAYAASGTAHIRLVRRY